VSYGARLVGSTTSDDFNVATTDAAVRAAAPATPPNEADERLAEQVFADHLRSSSGDAYRVLAVPANASTANIESAFAKLKAAYDPEKIASFPTPDLRAKGKEIFQRVVAAHEAIGESVHRLEYDRARKKATEAAPVKAPSTQGGDEAIRRGVDLLAAHQYAEAEVVFAEAARAHPGEPLFRIHLAWARYNAAKDDAERGGAADLLHSAVDELPNSDIGYQYLGIIAQRSGDRALAEEMFKKALVFNPKNTVALQELGFGSDL
jgi:tetratricopeptide (TPR) repeat protein